MTTRWRATIALLVVSTLGAACTTPGEPTAASSSTMTVTTTTTATATAPAETVTPSAVTVTETARPAAQEPAVQEPGATSTAGGSSPALGALATLPVKGRAPKTGYDRAQFGQAWSDAVGVDGGRNGCDTRNDVLRRDLTGIALDPGTGGCVVLTGTLQDAFTGTTISFVRGQDTSREVQVDHIVSVPTTPAGA